MKGVMDQREVFASIEALEDIIEENKFNMGKAYKILQNMVEKPTVRMRGPELILSFG